MFGCLQVLGDSKLAPDCSINTKNKQIGLRIDTHIEIIEPKFLKWYGFSFRFLFFLLNCPQKCLEKHHQVNDAYKVNEEFVSQLVLGETGKHGNAGI